MTQNSMRLSWDAEKVEKRLQDIMNDIHEKCKKYGNTGNGRVNYVTGATMAGFVKVADAMIAQGAV